MKVISMQEFLELEGNVMYAIVGKDWNKNGDTDFDLGTLHVRAEKLNATNWYEWRPMDADVVNLAGVDPDGWADCEDLLNGKRTLPYEPSLTRDYPACFDEGVKILILEQADIIEMFSGLAKSFPEEFATVAAQENK